MTADRRETRVSILDGRLETSRQHQKGIAQSLLFHQQSKKTKKEKSQLEDFLRGKKTLG